MRLKKGDLVWVPVPPDAGVRQEYGRVRVVPVTPAGARRPGRCPMPDPKPITVDTRVRTAKGFTGTVVEVKGNRARVQFDAPEGIASPPAWVATRTAEEWAREYEVASCGS